jgi:hypothetical protein
MGCGVYIINFRNCVLHFWDGALLLCSCVSFAVYAVVGVELLLHDQPGSNSTLRLSDTFDALPSSLTVAVGDLHQSCGWGVSHSALLCASFHGALCRLVL